MTACKALAFSVVLVAAGGNTRVQGQSPWSTGTGTIYETGSNVGIGTASPSATLTISGAPFTTSLAIAPSTGPNLFVNASGWFTTGNAGAQGQNLGADGARVGVNQDPSAYNSQFVVNKNSVWADSALFLGGNVGIGTTTPGATLDVRAPYNSFNGNVNGLSGTSILNVVSTSSAAVDVGATINLGGESGNTTDPYSFAGIKGAKESSSAGNYAGYLAFYTVAAGSAENEQMRITSAGNVGIGTTVPQSKLAVDGTVTAKEIVVTSTGWPDYVFDSGYQLTSLTEVGDFIKAHRHLPDIPSAEEVSEKGLNVGQMQSKLLAKIEELTLRAIEADRKIEALELRNSQMLQLLEQLGSSSK